MNENRNIKINVEKERVAAKDQEVEADNINLQKNDSEKEDDNEVIDPVKEREEKIDALEKEAKESYDRFLRVSAEFENYKKRAGREMEDFRKYANEALLKEFLPIRPCKAEDSYLLFKVLEFKYKAVFCEECYTETERTKTAQGEELYKRRTVGGIYQALSYTQPPHRIKLFYFLLPIASPLLLVLGKKGFYWMKGILLGLMDYLRGDRTGVWKVTYM